MKTEILQILYNEREKCFNVDLDKMTAKILQLFNDKIDSAEDEIAEYLDMGYCNTSQKKVLHIINIIKEKVNDR